MNWIKKYWETAKGSESFGLWTICFPVGLLLLNGGIKFFHITDSNIRGDEHFSLYHAQMSVRGIIHLLSQGNNPPGFETILHYWIKLLGIGETTVRFPSLLASALSSVAIYFLGKKFFTLRVAITASLLFTFSNYFLSYGMQCRVYSIFSFLAIASMFLLFSILNGERKSLFKIALVLISTTLLYLHFFSLIFIAVQFFIIMLYHIRNKQSNYALPLLGFSALFYLPYCSILLQRFSSSSKGTWVPAPNSPEDLYNFMRIFTNQPIVAVSAIALFIIAVLIFFLTKKKEVSTWTLSITAWFFIPFFGMFAASYLIPMMVDRYLIFAVPALYILIPVAIETVAKKEWIKNFASLLFIVLMLSTFNPNSTQKKDIQQIVSAIKNEIKEGAIVIISPRDFCINIAYYFDHAIFKDVNEINICDNIVNDFRQQNIFFANRTDSLPLEKIREAKRIIYVDGDTRFFNGNADIEDYLKTTCTEPKPQTIIDKFSIHTYLK